MQSSPWPRRHVRQGSRVTVTCRQPINGKVRAGVCDRDSGRFIRFQDFEEGDKEAMDQYLAALRKQYR